MMAQNNKNNKKLIIREIITWGIMLVLLFAISRIFTSSKTPQAQTVPYSEFISDIKNEEMQSVIIKMQDTSPSGVIGVLKNGQSIQANTPGDVNLLIKLLTDKNITFSVPRSNSTFWSIFWSIVPWVLIIGFWWFIMQRMMQGAGGGANQAFKFGKSQAKLFVDTKPKITFKDVAGAEEVKEEVKEIIEFLKNPKKFSKYGAKMPKGVLLVGPPGCGKTLIARAISGQADVPFFSVSGSEFVEMFVGVGASRVRDLFTQARTYAPCIVFIDEIDAVGRHRGAGIGGGNDEREQTLNQLLSEMDGFDPHTGIIIVAATNRPDILDPALLRPGRFDRRIVVGLPDTKEREEILKLHAKGKPFATEVDLNAIAQQTAGFTGADLENLLNEATLLTVRKGTDQITQKEVEEAIDKVIAGPERKSLVLSPEEKHIVAVHETGHAVVAKALPTGDIVHRISVVSRGMALGYNLQLPEKDKYLQKKSELMNRISSLLGGRAAEEVLIREISTGAANDLEKATDIARKMVRAYGMSDKLGPLTFGKENELIFLGKELGEERNYSEKTADLIDAEVKKIVESCYEKAKRVIKNQIKVTQLVAETLKDKETLQGEELKKFLDMIKVESEEENPKSIPTNA
ncbi:MAG: cell division protein FtsH [Caldiserica bacterium CG17_big_fil_post_rev_8_21_14_2_50_35_7]|nr:MAG: cell division protein FtsH [Caldiserica bacterium CG17_big_fil_post_rev_8_21_14_2_50_35_7]